jgi:hypothetical protein
MMKVFIGSVIAVSAIMTWALLSCISPEQNRQYVDENIYSLSTTTYVPDSLRTIQAKWITETMRAASNRLTTSDYEDPEDVLEQAQSTSDHLFGRSVPCLRISHSDRYEYVLIKDMTAEQRVIYDRLIQRQQESSLR